MDWYIYAVISAVFAGISHFSSKVAAENNNDSSLASFHGALSVITVAAIAYFFNPGINNIFFVVSLGILNSLFYFVSTYSRIDSLKYIHATLFYPIYKTINSILIVIIGFLVFNESLSLMQIIGFVIGIITMMLLIHKKEHKIQKNLKLGLTLLGFGILGAVTSASFGKVISQSQENIFAFIFISSSFMLLQSLFRYKKTKKIVNSKKNVKRMAYIGGVTSFISFYSFIKAMQGGSFAVVYMINSFSVVIITILSVWLYKDHLDRRKVLALILTLVSLALMK